MIIRKARKKDLEQFIGLKKNSLKEYSVIAGCKIEMTNKQIKKELFEVVSNPKRVMLFVEKEGVIKGFLIATLIISEYKDFGYIDDLFVSKDARGMGFASLLVNNFFKILKGKKIRDVRLGVNIRNEKAINLYKKLGFEIKHYEMDKKLK